MMVKKMKFTPEFKLSAVKLVTEQGYSQAEAGRSLGVDSKNINRWVKEAKDQDYKPERDQEILALRKQVKRLQMERDILKKAATSFANELH